MVSSWIDGARAWLVVTFVFAAMGLFAAAAPDVAGAAQAFDQARAADIGTSEIGTTRPAANDGDPGMCVMSVMRWIKAAGGSMAGGGPVSAYRNSPADLIATGNAEVVARAVKGDVIQYVPDSAPNEWRSGVHTVMVTANNGDGTLGIVQSNVVARGKVSGDPRWTPRPPATFTAYLWRFGQVTRAAAEPTEGQRFTAGGPQQYVRVLGASLPVSSPDAAAYDAAGNRTVVRASADFLVTHPASVFPEPRVVRPVGSAAQLLYTVDPDGRVVLRSVDDGVTSSCLLAALGQPAPSEVPTGWLSTVPRAQRADCALPNGTRFVEGSDPRQWIAVGSGGAAVPVSYSDAQALDAEGNSRLVTLASGYVAQHPPSSVKREVVVRIAGTPKQAFLTADGRLRAIEDGVVSSCLLLAEGQSSPLVVPGSWAGAVPTGPAMDCALPDGMRFVETGSAAQWISQRGVAIPVADGADAVRYRDDERNPTVYSVAAGYAARHAAVGMPRSVVRLAGSRVQALFEDGRLYPIDEPATSACLLTQTRQPDAAVVPQAWAASLPRGTTARC